MTLRDNFIIITFLSKRYVEVSEELENYPHKYPHLYIKYETDQYVLYDIHLTIQLVFNRKDIIELLILYQHYGSYIRDKNDIPYDGSERPNINIRDRRAGMMAAINYFN